MISALGTCAYGPCLNPPHFYTVDGAGELWEWCFDCFWDAVVPDG